MYDFWKRIFVGKRRRHEVSGLRLQQLLWISVRCFSPDASKVVKQSHGIKLTDLASFPHGVGGLSTCKAIKNMCSWSEGQKNMDILQVANIFLYMLYTYIFVFTPLCKTQCNGFNYQLKIYL